MARTYTQINANTDIWQVWFDRTNTMLDAFSETVTLKANTAGDTSSGNGFVTGIFGATTLVGTTIRGGNVNTPAHIIFSSNANFTGSQINSTANVLSISTSQVFQTNSSVTALSITSNGSSTNTNIAGDNFRITANSIFNGITATTFAANGVSTLSANLSVTAESQLFQTNSSITAISITSNGTTSNTDIAGDNLNVTANAVFSKIDIAGLATFTSNADFSGNTNFTANISVIANLQQFSTNSSITAISITSNGTTSNTNIAGDNLNATANISVIANLQQFSTNSSITAISITSNGTTSNTNIAGDNLNVTANSKFTKAVTANAGLTFASGNSITNYTVSTSAPSGGNNGDVWVVVVS